MILHVPSDERSDVLTHVGANVRRLRLRAGLSQVDLAERAGVSRRTIINLEAGEANVSLSALDRLADALGAVFVDLVTPEDATPGTVDVTAWRGSSPDSTGALRGVAPARREAQLWTWSLAPGDRYDAEPDPAGWHEMLLVTRGALLLDLETGPLRLPAGQHTTYPSTQTYSYVNDTDDVTTFVRVVVS